MLYHIQTSKFQRYMVTKSRFRINTAQKMKFSIKDFRSKCDQIRSFWDAILGMGSTRASSLTLFRIEYQTRLMFQIKQEMLHILTIAISEIMNMQCKILNYRFSSRLLFKKGVNLVTIWNSFIFHAWRKTSKLSLREKCPNTEFFLVRIFPYSDWIRIRKNSVFGYFSRRLYLCFIFMPAETKYEIRGGIFAKLVLSSTNWKK